VTDLEAAIEAGDAERALGLMSTLTESERRALAPIVARAHEGAHRACQSDNDRHKWLRHAVSVLALFGTATLSQVRSCPFESSDDRIADVLIARRPTWLQEWCDGVATRRWGIVRRIVRAGACQRRRSEAYALGLMLHVSRLQKADPRHVLAEQPELLEEEIWDFFRYEGVSDISLAAMDKYTSTDRRWSVVLAELAAQGKIPRERLLDASLDALERDFLEFRAGWFSRFHELLAPTPEERATRLERYVRLLASRVGPTVSFAIDALVSVAKMGGALPHESIAALTPAYRAKAKRTALAALALGERLLEHETMPSWHAPRFANALEHPAREVQVAALRIIERFGDRNDPTLIEKLAAATATVVPTLLPRIDALMPGAMRRNPRHDELAIGVQPRARASVPLRRAPVAVVPIASLDELVETYGIVLETDADPHDYERVLAGVSLLCAERPHDFERITGPLRKRVAKLLGDNAPWDLALPRHLFAMLANAWLRGELLPVTLKEHRKCERFLAARVHEVAARVAQNLAAPVLAAPTHASGTIDPAAFAQRFLEVGGDAAHHDAIAALLRLSADGRADALRVVRRLEGETAHALRYALGDDTVTIGADAALWIAASRSRYPSTADPIVEATHPNLGPDATRPATIDVAWPLHEWTAPPIFGAEPKTYRYHSPVVTAHPASAAPAPFDMPTVAVYENAKGAYLDARTTAATLRWLGTVWPANRDGWFAAGCMALGANLDWSEARWWNRAYLEPLSDPDVALRKGARTLTAFALLAKDAAEGVLAVDGVIAGISDSRLDVAGLDDIFDCVISWIPYTKLKRAVPRIATVAKASPIHARLIADAIERVLKERAPENTAPVRALRDIREEILAEDARSQRERGGSPAENQPQAR